jgi:hypothetical protein
VAGGGFKGGVVVGQSEARLTITAPRDAATNLFAPVIVGKAKLGQAEVVRIAEPTEEATQAFNYKHLIPTKEYPVTLSEAPSFTLSVNLPSKEPLNLRPEGEVQVPVKAYRNTGGQGEISLALTAPPAGLSMKPAVIPADKDEVAVAIGVPAGPCSSDTLVFNLGEIPPLRVAQGQISSLLFVRNNWGSEPVQFTSSPVFRLSVWDVIAGEKLVERVLHARLWMSMNSCNGYFLPPVRALCASDAMPLHPALCPGRPGTSTTSLSVILACAGLGQ